MKRRAFITKMIRFAKWGAIAALVPISWQACGSGRGKRVVKMRDVADKISLRQIAEKKLHHGSDGFLNPFSEYPPGAFTQVLKWKLFTENHFSEYYKDEEVRRVKVDWDKVRGHDDLSVTYLKHSSVFIKDRNTSIIVDPVLGGIFSFIKDFSPLDFTVDDMPKPDYLLITHGHYDHLDKPSLRKLDDGLHAVSPIGYDSVFSGIKMKRSQLDWFESVKENGLEITLLPCNHWTMRNPLVGPNKSLWGSYIVKTPSGFTIFLSGDAAYFNGYGDIGEEYEIDLAVFNLGAYEPRWFMKKSHMNPEEAVRAFKELKARRMMIVHWGTFRLGDEPVHFPPIDIRKAMSAEGIADQLVHVNHGQTVFYKNGDIMEVS